jgi:hypothetical protein
MLQALLAARRLALHSQLCYRGSSRAACGAFAGKWNSRALSTEAAPVEDEGGDDVGDFGFHLAGRSTQQAWLTNLDGTKIGLINVSNYIFGARMSANWFHDRSEFMAIGNLVSTHLIVDLCRTPSLPARHSAPSGRVAAGEATGRVGKSERPQVRRAGNTLLLCWSIAASLARMILSTLLTPHGNETLQ